MSFLIIILTLLILSITAVAFWENYKLKALLHPGFAFCLLWIITIISYYLFADLTGLGTIFDPQAMNELHSFVLFSGLFFFLVQRSGQSNILKHDSSWNVSEFSVLFTPLAIICLLLAMYNFIRQGGSLNFLMMRQRMVMLSTMRYNGEISFSMVDTLIGIANNLNSALAIFAGYYLARYHFSGHFIPSRIGFWSLILPLFAYIFTMLAVGGRNDFIIGCRQYFFGAAIALGSSKKMAFSVEFRKFVRYVLVLLVVFLTYSNFSHQQRMNYGGAQESIDWSEAPMFLRPFSSTISYLSSSMMGYQYRRNDYVIKGNLSWGEKTFSGILFWAPPLTGTLGQKFTIGKMLGMKQYVMKDVFLELQSQKADFFSAIFPIYLLMYADFGYWGTVLLSLFFVLSTQWIFCWWFRHPHRYFIAVFLPLIFFWLWSNSIFPPVFSVGLPKQFLYSLVLCDLLLHFCRHNKSKKTISEKPVAVHIS